MPASVRLFGMPRGSADDARMVATCGTRPRPAGATIAVHWDLPERMVQVVGAVHQLDWVAEDGEPLNQRLACVVLADGLCAELGKAVLPAPDGWYESEALRFLDGRATLEGPRQIAAQNLGAEANVPM